MSERVREGRAAVSGVAVALLVLAGCGGASGGGENAAVGDPPGGPSVTVAFATAAPAGDFTPATSATLADTESLYVVADWRDVPAGQTVRVLIASPDGTSYFDQLLPLEDGTVGLSSVVTSAEARRMVVRLPVWGTDIETYHRVGAWTATVSLQGADLAGAAQVELQ